MVGAAAVQIALLVDLAVASMLPAGTVSYLSYANRVAHLLPSVVGVAAATALLPYLSHRTGGGGAAAAAQATSRTLEVGLLLSLPGAAALVVIAEPAIATLFQRGAFTSAATAATAPALAAYAAGLPAWILIQTLGSVFFARGDTYVPMSAAAAAVVLNLALSLLLMGPLLHLGIALATAVAAWFHAIVLLAVLQRRGWFVPDARLRRKMPAIATASVVMAGVLWLVRLAFGDLPAASETQRLTALALLVAAGLVSFATLAWVTRALRLGDIVRAWRSRSGDS